MYALLSTVLNAKKETNKQQKTISPETLLIGMIAVNVHIKESTRPPEEIVREILPCFYAANVLVCG